MYLFVRGSTNPGPRVTRVMRYFERNGKSVFYLSPQRGDDMVEEGLRRLGTLGCYDYFDGSGYLGYLVYLLRTNGKIASVIITERSRIDLAHFSDLESVLFGGLVCKVLRIPFVYNIHDNYFQRYNFHKSISLLLKYIECFYIRLSDVTLVPEEFRKLAYPRKVFSKISVLRNYPDFDVSTDRLPLKGEEIRMFYGGWISPNRNIELYLSLGLALRAANYKVSLSLCGWGDSDYLEDILHKFREIDVQAKYLGQLSQMDAVNVLRESDLCIAYYNPDKLINIYAASNKIPEIVGSSTILITNSQTEIAKKIAKENISLQFDARVEEILPDLMNLIESKELTKQFVDRALRYYRRNYSQVDMFNSLENYFGGYV
jgi:Glycosyltransferase Family 4